MNAKYRALHEALGRINRTLNSAPMLASPYKPEDAGSLYLSMIELVPVGTRVRVTYIANPSNPAKITTREGVVGSHATISIDEPDFHIYFEESNSTILLPGSVLEAV